MGRGRVDSCDENSLINAGKNPQAGDYFRARGLCEADRKNQPGGSDGGPRRSSRGEEVGRGQVGGSILARSRRKSDEFGSVLTMDWGTEGPRDAGDRISMRGCGWISGSSTGEGKVKNFVEQHDFFARISAAHAGGTDLPGVRDFVEQSISEIGFGKAVQAPNAGRLAGMLFEWEYARIGGGKHMRISADKDQPSLAVELPIVKPLPDYDLHQVEQPTPRDIDGVLVSQGFRDLVDDARGVLMELIANPPQLPNRTGRTDLELNHIPDFEITQLTGAICPGEEEVYRPGLWIVLKDRNSPENKSLNEVAMEHARSILHEFVKRLGIS